MKDGKVYINGSDTPLDEPYLPEPMEGSYGPYEVPEGCYFMMGDNGIIPWMPVSGIINSLQEQDRGKSAVLLLSV